VLHVHRAERADGLVAALADLLSAPPADPFAAEVVSVPTRGMERWLAQSLSTRLGICANVDFPPPGRLVREAVAAACGVDPDTDPWRPERATWALLDVVDEQLDAPWLAPLKRYLGPETDAVKRARRLGIVRHLAELFDRYALHRPDTVRGWAGGRDGDWQAELWRCLRERIGQASPAERLQSATDRLRAENLLDLPERLSVFGLTRLPAGHLDVLAALAARRDVHLFLLHPSPRLWDAIGTPNVVRRKDDPTALTPVHPLLASWGRDAREMQLVLGRAPHEDHHHPVSHRDGTLLAGLQADIRADRAPHGRAGADPDPSLEIHACHGRARQVEVLRDAILRALADDPTLEPRDVIVMCPDIETCAPLIQATFGAGELARDDELELPPDAKPIDLRVRLADRSLRQTNPVLGVVAQALELAGQRVTASEVLDLADREAVRRRFRFDDDDLARLQSWIAESGIRWGLDPEHRSRYRLEKIDAGTWRFGIDRLLTGVTMTEDRRRLLHGVLPLDDVDSASIDLAGRFTELVARLADTIDAFSRPQPIAGWAQAIADAADALAATRPREAWQRAELQRILDDVVTHADAAEADLALAEVRGLLAERLAGRPTRANFRTGHLTICTLVPMRSVPHRVVCLLGLDDGVFPRKAPHDGDDLMLEDPRVGERDPRAEDRQQLLDALLAARDRLIVTYTGNDERTNAEKPPAVPIGELLDVAGTGVLIRHPLQPFDPRNFDRARPSFDRVMLGGARALQAERVEPGRFLPNLLPPLEEEVIELDELVRFVEHPVRRFLRRRLGVDPRDFWEEVEDDLDIELDGLGKWSVGERLLRSRLEGVDERGARLAEIARGKLPPGQLGRPAVREAEPVVADIVAAAGTAEAASVDVRVTLPDGRSLRGTVPGVCGTTLRAVTFSRINARHRAVAWVRLLALTASDPGGGYDARTIGKGGVKELTAPADPVARLGELVALYELGMRAPLPLACKTSAAWVQAGEPAARKEWESSWDFPKEDSDAEHVRVYGRALSFDELAARPGFQTLAHQLWDPILAAER
jgi:exodeoxyribonuclease V gamma subunit